MAWRTTDSKQSKAVYYYDVDLYNTNNQKERETGRERDTHTSVCIYVCAWQVVGWAAAVRTYFHW
jgi:hypothetical protein